MGPVRNAPVPNRRLAVSSARLRGRRGVSPELVRGAARLVGGHGLEDLVLRRRMVERAEFGERFARCHLLRGSLGSSLSDAADAVAQGDFRRVLASMAR